MTRIRLALRYQVMLSSGPDNNVEANITAVDELHEIDPAETALVLVDTWNKHPIRSHKDRTAEIMRDRIAPLLPELRAIGVSIIHAPSPEVAERYPQWQARFADRPRKRQETASWPPPDLKNGRFNRRPGEHPSDFAGPFPDWWHWDAIHDVVAPRPGDAVIANGDELHELLSEQRRSLLFYAGFAANICVPHRDYGILAMGARGYLPILLRDCTTAIEIGETLEDFTTTRLAIQDVERRYYTADSRELISACREAMPR